MAENPDLPGLSYDPGHARSIADGCSGVLRQAHQLGATTGDQLAALAILVARVAVASGLKRNPGVAAAAVSAMAMDVAARGSQLGLLDVPTS